LTHGVHGGPGTGGELQVEAGVDQLGTFGGVVVEQGTQPAVVKDSTEPMSAISESSR